MKLTQSHPIRSNHHNIDIGLDYAKDVEYRRFVIRFLKRMGYAFINDLKKVEK